VGLSEDSIVVSEAVTAFIGALKKNAVEPMRALGALGIGNELMLLAEFHAVESCFETALPTADYKNFLHANIGEDESHTRLIGEAATALSKLGYSSAEFLLGAREGVAARLCYYDALLKQARSMA
jgi:hypothetical protein